VYFVQESCRCLCAFSCAASCDIEFLKTSLKAVSVTKTDTTPGDGPGRVVKVRIYQSSERNGVRICTLAIYRQVRAYFAASVLLQDNVRVMLGKSANTLSYEFKAGSGKLVQAEMNVRSHSSLGSHHYGIQRGL
jgi:hypothetical protein